MNTTENKTAKDFFKVVGILIGATFTALLFFLRLLGGSSKSEENTDLFAEPENEFDNLTSVSAEALTNPMNGHNMNDD